LILADLSTRYRYRTRFFQDPQTLLEQIRNKTVVPSQVEVQPPPAGKAICWMPCPYCYGLSARDDGSRLTLERYVQIMHQIADGGVPKIIFGGYATDPLNSLETEDLLQVVLDRGQVFGFHTKALQIGERLLARITSREAAATSYFSVSVDACDNQVYQAVHGLNGQGGGLFDKVLKNLRRVADARDRTGGKLDLSVTYLVNHHNSDPSQIRSAMEQIRDSGVDMIRFTYHQVPRGYDPKENDPDIFSLEEVETSYEVLKPLVDSFHSERFQALIYNMDSKYDLDGAHRTLPCLARYIYPSIGFDGWLGHCSQSTASNFRDMSLGNLAERDFWDLYYDYDSATIHENTIRNGELMNSLGCRCDRKEHAVNGVIRDSGILDH